MGAIEGEGICNGCFVLGREGGRVWVIGREVTSRGEGGVTVFSSIEIRFVCYLLVISNKVFYIISFV